MSEEKLLDAFSEETRLLANDGVERGLHPIHVANILMLAGIQISVQMGGVEETRRGLILAASQLGADNLQ